MKYWLHWIELKFSFKYNYYTYIVTQKYYISGRPLYAELSPVTDFREGKI